MQKNLAFIAAFASCAISAGAAPQQAAVVQVAGPKALALVQPIHVDVSLQPIDASKALFLGIQLESVGATPSIPQLSKPGQRGAIRDDLPVVSMAFEADRERLPDLASEVVAMSGGDILRWDSLPQNAEGQRIHYELSWAQNDPLLPKGVANAYRRAVRRAIPAERSIGAAIARILTSLHEHGVSGVRLEYSGEGFHDASPIPFRSRSGTNHAVKVTFDASADLVPDRIGIIKEAAGDALGDEGRHSWATGKPSMPEPAPLLSPGR